MCLILVFFKNQPTDSTDQFSSTIYPSFFCIFAIQNRFMLNIGTYHDLEILRHTPPGLYLTDGEQEILLPNKYIPEGYKMGEKIRVFVYLDHEERLVATTLEPYVTLHNFAWLRVNYTNNFGAFMDWGLEKDLFVPFKEQARPMQEGYRYLVYAYLDEQSKRLVASSKLNQFLNNDLLTFQEHDEVDLIVSHITDLGVNVIINEKHKGLIYKNEMYQNQIRPGDRMKGFIKSIRADGKVDVSLQKSGFENIEINAQIILDMLKKGRGYLRLHDKSSSEDIKTVLQMSKKTFKKSIGTLYKDKIIDIKEDGIYLL